MSLINDSKRKSDAFGTAWGGGGLRKVMTLHISWGKLRKWKGWVRGVFPALSSDEG